MGRFGSKKEKKSDKSIGESVGIAAEAEVKRQWRRKRDCENLSRRCGSLCSGALCVLLAPLAVLAITSLDLIKCHAPPPAGQTRLAAADGKIWPNLVAKAAAIHSKGK